MSSNEHSFEDSYGARASSSIRGGEIRISRLNGEMNQLADIAEGSFGVVKAGVLDVDHRHYAVKQTKKIITGEGDLQQKLQEVYALSACSHPNILRYHDGWVEEKTVSVRTELLPDGSVSDFQTPLPEKTLRALLHQVAAALYEIHSRGIAHRDVKPENILMRQMDDDSFVFKLCDFGLARPTTVTSGIADTGEHFRGVNDDDGDRNYLSPEAFSACESPQVGPKADIYALGATCVKLMGGDPEQVREGMYPYPRDVEYDPSLVHLIKSMTSLDPNARPDAFTVVTATLESSVRSSSQVMERHETVMALQERLERLRIAHQQLQ